MIVGHLSIDPRRVLSAKVEKDHGEYVLYIQYQLGSNISELTTDFGDIDDAINALSKVNDMSYTEPMNPVDLSKAIYQGNEIGF